MSTEICGEKGKKESKIVTTLFGRDGPCTPENLGNSSVFHAPSCENLERNTKHGVATGCQPVASAGQIAPGKLPVATGAGFPDSLD